MDEKEKAQLAQDLAEFAYRNKMAQMQTQQNNMLAQMQMPGGLSNLQKSPSVEFVFDMVMAGVEKHLRRIVREEIQQALHSRGDKPQE